MGSTAALPRGAALTAPTLRSIAARGMAGQEGHQVFHHADGADAGPPPP
jgi:hypothetical protein